MLSLWKNTFFSTNEVVFSSIARLIGPIIWHSKTIWPFSPSPGSWWRSHRMNPRKRWPSLSGCYYQYEIVDFCQIINPLWLTFSEHLGVAHQKPTWDHVETCKTKCWGSPSKEKGNRIQYPIVHQPFFLFQKQESNFCSILLFFIFLNFAAMSGSTYGQNKTASPIRLKFGQLQSTRMFYSSTRL